MSLLEKEMGPRTIYDRKHGRYRSMDDVTEPHMVKARRSERLVGEYLTSLGFRVQIGNGIGPDLICFDGIKEIKVEVKSTIKLGHTESWKVGAMSPYRADDDWIAIVLPNDTIIIEPMALHLKLSSRSGERTITNLVRRHGAA